MFAVSPSSGLLKPTDKPLPLQITFSPKREVVIQNEPVLRCRLVEPKTTNALQKQSPTEGKAAKSSKPQPSTPTAQSIQDGEAIANIPLRVSGRASFIR